MSEKNKEGVLDTIKKLIKSVRKAQVEFSTFSQEKVDKIFHAVATCAINHRLELARLAVDETGMGVFEDKVIKNHYASEYIYNAYKNVKTCGVIEEDLSFGIQKIAEPLGVVAGIIPTTNPTSTAIFKILICLKTRNAIILSPHPRAKDSTIKTAKLLLESAVKAGAPKGIISWIESPTVELSNELMKEVDMILATGGAGMVKSAYSSGKPAIGVGAGNVPAVIDKSANLILAVNSIIHSKTFDNGVICSSEQSVIVDKSVYNAVKDEFLKRGCYFLKGDEVEKVRKIILDGDSLNSKIVGQTAVDIAKFSGVKVPENTKILIGEVEKVGEIEPFSYEKLSPILAMYKADDLDHALSLAESLVLFGGLGHTSSIYINENEKEKISAFSQKLKTSRILVNTPSAQGGIGDLYNFKLAPSLTLGCGSWGGNSVSENVGVKHLLNIKTVALRRENMLWLRTPEKVYLKKGCLSFALDELSQVLGKKRAFIVTDSYLFKNGYLKPITEKLASLDIEYTVFYDVEPDPTLQSARVGAKEMSAFSPDCIIAFGGGSAMDAAKIMWVLYENPSADFSDMALRFMDIRKRVYTFNKMGKKAYFIAIPTSAGSGSEVTPFAVITDEKTGVKYPLADYELMPNMAIVDSNFHLTSPKSLTMASGIDALIHSLEALVSMFATDFTDGLALQSLKIIFEHLPRAYKDGSCEISREKMANAASMAGVSFANAFLGVCHSMAHKLGAFFNLPHGLANALLIEQVIRFNAEEVPTKMGTFSQYQYPSTLKKYALIATELGLGGDSDEEKLESLIKHINELKKKIEIKEKISDYVPDEKAFLEKLDEMTLLAFDDQCTGANPRYPLLSEIKQMYLNAYYGTNKKV